MPCFTFDSFRYGQDTGPNRVDYLADTIKVALVTSLYVPIRETHDFFNDITNEVTGSGYTAGGLTLSGKSMTIQSNRVLWKATDAFWAVDAAGPQNARTGILYKSTGVASTSPLIGYLPLGVDRSIRISPGFTIALSQGILLR